MTLKMVLKISNIGQNTYKSIKWIAKLKKLIFHFSRSRSNSVTLKMVPKNPPCWNIKKSHEAKKAEKTSFYTFQGQGQIRWPWKCYQKIHNLEMLKKGLWSISVNPMVSELFHFVCDFYQVWALWPIRWTTQNHQMTLKMVFKNQQ